MLMWFVAAAALGTCVHPPAAGAAAPAQHDHAETRFAATALAQKSTPDEAFTRLQYLIGDWAGEGSGSPGEGAGGFSIHFELGGKVLVRRNRADYPATAERPASSHEDLMVIYPDGERGGLRAVYWDNEGHVIHYEVKSPAEGRVEFVSDRAAPGPRYRLTYAGESSSLVSITFEIAPPGKPDAFKAYIRAKARRLPERPPPKGTAPKGTPSL